MEKTLAEEREERPGSAGHRLGQSVGGWWEEFFVLPLLTDAAQRLDLYLDSRFQKRTCRGEKPIWADADGNGVDYDFVLELDGSDAERGIPVGFIEVFWRRGSRHSKDKARDDTGKLRPMRETYPTARFLGIVAGGDFTQPAREYVKNQAVDLFCVQKHKIIEAFRTNDLVMDYHDKSAEGAKREIADRFEASFDLDAKQKVGETLLSLIGRSSLEAYSLGVVSAIAALPQELRFIYSTHSQPAVFETIPEATAFLDDPKFSTEGSTNSYQYEITYSDGTDFGREVATLDDLKQLHEQVSRMAEHMERLAEHKRF